MKYKATLSDGRAVTVESDHAPSEDEVLQAVNAYQPETKTATQSVDNSEFIKFAKGLPPPDTSTQVGKDIAQFQGNEPSISAMSRWQEIKYKLANAFGIPHEGSESRKQLEAIPQAAMIAPLGLPERLGKMLMVYFAAKTINEQIPVAKQIRDEIQNKDYSAAKRTAIEDALNIGIVGSGLMGTFGGKSSPSKLSQETAAAGAPLTSQEVAKTIQKTEQAKPNSQPISGRGLNIPTGAKPSDVQASPFSDIEASTKKVGQSVPSKAEIPEPPLFSQAIIDKAGFPNSIDHLKQIFPKLNLTEEQWTDLFSEARINARKRVLAADKVENLQDIVPAIETTSGELKPADKGTSHNEAIEKHGLSAEDINKRTYMNVKTGKEVPPENLAKAGLQTASEKGQKGKVNRVHSDTLDEAQKILKSSEPAKVPVTETITPTTPVETSQAPATGAASRLQVLESIPEDMISEEKKLERDKLQAQSKQNNSKAVFEAAQAKAGLPKFPTKESVQKFKVGNSPQLHSIVEKLPQTDVEKANGEQPIRIKNDKTGEKSVVMESDLTPVKQSTTPKVPKQSVESKLKSLGYSQQEITSMDKKGARALADRNQPKIVGMGGAIPEEFGKTDFGTTGAGQDIYGVAERVRKARAASGQVAPVPTGEGVSAEEAVKWGQELLARGGDAEKALKDFESDKKTSFDLIAVARAKGEELAKSARSIEEKFGTDSNEYRMAQKALSDWDTRTKSIQTEWHKQGMAQQGETDLDTGSFTGIQRAFHQITGEDLPKFQESKAKQIARGVKQAEDAAEAVKPKLETAIDNITETGKPESPKVKVEKDLGSQQKVFQDYKSGQPMNRKQVKTLWTRAKSEYIVKGNDDKADIVHKLAEDFGIPAKDVLKGLAQTNQVKRIADDLWQKQRQVRMLKQAAKRWIEHSEETWLQNVLPAAARTMFSLKTGFHGTVALGTHAPLTVATHPIIFAENFGKMYKLVASPEYYQMQQHELARRPNYTVAQRNGLVNDMSKMEDFNDPQLAQGFPKMAAWFKSKLDVVHLGRLQGMGTRGYSVLKIIRQDLFDYEWNKLPESMKSDSMAKAISDSVNHITGVTKLGAGAVGKVANFALFAPKLLASRVAVTVTDPFRLANSLIKMENMTPAEKWFATNQFKEKAKVFSVFTGLLLANQQLNKLFGDDKKLNGVPEILGGGGVNPMASDFMKFRIAGMNFAWGSPFLTMTRLPLRIYQIGAGSGGKTRFLIYPDESMYKTVGSYLRTQESPFLSPIVSLVTKADYQNRPLPKIPGYGEPPPMPKRLAAQGIKPYTWHEFITETILPIPFEEAAKEVFHNHGLTPSDKESHALLKSFITIVIMGGTGGRLSEDWTAAQIKPPKAQQPPGKNPPGQRQKE